MLPPLDHPQQRPLEPGPALVWVRQSIQGVYKLANQCLSRREIDDLTEPTKGDQEQ